MIALLKCNDTFLLAYEKTCMGCSYDIKIGVDCHRVRKRYFRITEILRQYFINHPQSIDKYTFLQNSAFTHWVKEKCSKMC